MKSIIMNLDCPCCVAYVAEVLEKVGVKDAEISVAGIVFSLPSDKGDCNELESRIALGGLKIQPHVTMPLATAMERCLASS